MSKNDLGANPSSNRLSAIPDANPSPPALAEHQVVRSGSQQVPAADSRTLNIALQNLAINHNNSPVLLQSKGRTSYYPQSPSSAGTPLSANCAIRLEAPIAGGKILSSINTPLTFLVNPGPALVKPNINISWTFCEFTYNDFQPFANISDVDFVSIPVSLTFTNNSGGGSQHVSTIPANGFTTACNHLRSQAAEDHQPWDQLIYSHNGQPIRALSPKNLVVNNRNAFTHYQAPYVQQVWSKFSGNNMHINCRTLDLDVAGNFSQPSGADIFSHNTGPFATGSNIKRNAVIPRPAAAFNRSTRLPCNHFPTGVGQNQSGAVMDGSPRLFTVAVEER
ncbi:glycoside hydrolase family 64 protein [Lepidopterella palustris CBS 459.81]|uniref:Glycoside hydrolase family 64 protein n=1 Tax=Lepidopterella palustris CBS 459.81 TaxID=1314670 RepID=A0A8E2DWI5_9PEZI|nr:glycoside hydrolase family 64 protein [Lepidopterella palustris CBS 459.81]